MTDSAGRSVRASVELLRAEAADELSVLIDERLRAGEDPWAFMEDLPTVDELAVLFLRSERLQQTRSGRPTRARNYEVMRAIAADYPEFTPAVWRLLGNEPYRAWDARIRA